MENKNKDFFLNCNQYSLAKVIPYIKIDALCEILQEEHKEHQEIQPVYQKSPICY